MAYLVCKEAFGFGPPKHRSLKDRIKATLQNHGPKLAAGAGILALTKLHLIRNRDQWVKRKESENYKLVDKALGKYENNGKVAYAPSTSIVDAVLNRASKEYSIKNESYDALYPGTFVANEGIIDDAKEKITDFGNSVKDTVRRNVGNIANGINYITSPIRNFANGVSDKLNSAQQSVSNFATNVVGSKNVKPVVQRPTLRQHF